jgi:outer membrane lipoprotein-sorting protein
MPTAAKRQQKRNAFAAKGIYRYGSANPRRRVSLCGAGEPNDPGRTEKRTAVLKTLTAILVFLLSPALHAAVDLETVLRNMDATAAKFQGLKADLEWIKYVAIVDIESSEKGVVMARRSKDKSVDLMIEFKTQDGKPYNYFVNVQGSKAQIYKPQIATVEEYDVSKSKDLVDQVLLLGFGPSGSYLKENYNVTLKGEEEAAGEQTVKLELIPKSKELLEKIPRLEMWVSKSNWHPVQDKLYEQNSGDYRLHTYTNIVLNPPLKDSDFRLNLPRNVKKVRPQK